MKTGLILVGLPGSGKSTFRRELQEHHAASSTNPMGVVSSDDIIDRFAAREKCTYNEAFTLCAKQAAKEADHDFGMQLEYSDNPIVIDRTNLSVKTRAKYIGQFRKYGYRPICFVIHCDEGDLYNRLEQRRGKVIPEQVINQMLDRFEYPRLDEGFTRIESIDTSQPYDIKHYYNILMGFELDSSLREWEYDGLGNKVYKGTMKTYG